MLLLQRLVQEEKASKIKYKKNGYLYFPTNSQITAANLITNSTKYYLISNKVI